MDERMALYLTPDGRAFPLVRPFEGAFQILLPQVLINEGRYSTALRASHERFLRVMQAEGARRNLLDQAMLAAHSASQGLGPRDTYEAKQGISVIAQRANVSEMYVPLYAFFLAGGVDPQAAMKALETIRALQEGKKIDPVYVAGIGPLDAVVVEGRATGKAVRFILSLDQGMLAAAAAKMLDPGGDGLAKYLHRAPYGERLRQILRQQDQELRDALKTAEPVEIATAVREALGLPPDRAEEVNDFVLQRKLKELRNPTLIAMLSAEPELPVIRHVPDEAVAELNDQSKTPWTTSLKTFLRMLNITVDDDKKILNFNDWLDLFERYRKARRLSHEELNEALEVLLGAGTTPVMMEGKNLTHYVTSKFSPFLLDEEKAIHFPGFFGRHVESLMTPQVRALIHDVKYGDRDIQPKLIGYLLTLGRSIVNHRQPHARFHRAESEAVARRVKSEIERDARMIEFGSQDVRRPAVYQDPRLAGYIRWYADRAIKVDLPELHRVDPRSP
ncbi:MAG: hypothetical protein HYW10_02265 [Candidatus Omnitrophica bacterium]|nr:hypothetical protein [Candidatus Omnitrophota bacterium]